MLEDSLARFLAVARGFGVAPFFCIHTFCDISRAALSHANVSLLIGGMSAVDWTSVKAHFRLSDEQMNALPFSPGEGIGRFHTLWQHTVQFKAPLPNPPLTPLTAAEYRAAVDRSHEIVTPYLEFRNPQENASFSPTSNEAILLRTLVAKDGLMNKSDLARTLQLNFEETDTRLKTLEERGFVRMHKLALEGGRGKVCAWIEACSKAYEALQLIPKSPGPLHRAIIWSASSYFVALGYSVFSEEMIGQKRVDLIARKDERTFLVECECRAKESVLLDRVSVSPGNFVVIVTPTDDVRCEIEDLFLARKIPMTGISTIAIGRLLNGGLKL